MISSDMKERKQWLLFNKVSINKHNREYRPKTPWSLTGSSSGCSLRWSETWGTYEEAQRAQQTLGDEYGIGFVFLEDDFFIGIDLDKCLDEDQVMTDEAAKVVEMFSNQGHIEVSPSGRGLRIIITGILPDDIRKKSKDHDFELYSKDRYLTITEDSDLFEGVNNEPQDCPLALHDFINDFGFKFEKKDINLSSDNFNMTRLSSSESVEGRASNYIEQAEKPYSGNRNNCLFRLAGHLTALRGYNGERLNEDQVIEYCMLWNSMLVDPIDSLPELQKTVQSAYSTADERITPKLPEIMCETIPTSAVDAFIAAHVGNDREYKKGADFAKEEEETVETEETSIEAYNKIKIPDGIIKDYVDYYMRKSPKTNGFAGLLSAMSFWSMIIGRKVKFNGILPNLYHILLAPSSSGKDSPLKLPEDIIYESGLTNLVGGHPKSPMAIFNLLEEHPCRLFTIDEISRELKSFTKNGIQGQVLDVMFRSYAESNRRYSNPATFMDTKRNIKLSHPYINVLGATTDSEFSSSISSVMVTSGFLPRFGIVNIPFGEWAKNPKPDWDAQIPNSIMKAIEEWRDDSDKFSVCPICGSSPCKQNKDCKEAFSSEDLLGDGFKAHDVPVATATKDAEELLEKHWNDIDRRQREENLEGESSRSAVWGRAMTVAKKYALIIASSRCPRGNTRITLEDAEFGIKLANSVASFTCKSLIDLPDRVGDNTNKKLRVWNLIKAEGRKNGLGCVMDSVIKKKKLSNWASGEVDKVLKQLLSEEILFAKRIIKKTSPAIFWSVTPFPEEGEF